MKIFFSLLYLLSLITASILATTGNLIGIGYFLYLWSTTTVASTSAWIAFVLWLKLMGGAILAIFTAALSDRLSE